MKSISSASSTIDPGDSKTREVMNRLPVMGPVNARTYEIDRSELAIIAHRAERAGWRFISITADAISQDNDQPIRLDLVFNAPGEQVPIVLRLTGNGEVTSISRVFPGASWSEREIQDLYGLTFGKMPDARPIVHHEDWPKGLCPLRAGEELELPVERVPGEFPYSSVDGEGVMEIRVGPIHAGIIEPGHFRFSAIGEMVVSLEARLFYVHRGLEQRAVSMTPTSALVLAERISGTSVVGHGLAAARAIEAALGVVVPPFHCAIRGFLLELERFYNHVADLGNLCAGTALSGLLAEGLLMKEQLWEACARLTGSRQLRGLIGVGGLRRCPSPSELTDALGALRQGLKRLEIFAEKFFGSASNLERLTGTGVLEQEHARKLGTVGVVARASGLACDSRFDFACSELEKRAYEGLEPVCETSGDVLARAQVRLREARDSVQLSERLIELAEENRQEISAVMERDSGEGIGWAEGPRGEILTYARLEKRRIARLRVRSPSRMNWPALALATPGDIVPDFPLINKSFNLSYAGCDL